MDPLFLIVVAIAGLTGYTWYRGLRQSRAVIRAATRAAEHAFRPTSTEYINIGGAVGYHFTFTLESPLVRVEGTITTVPRHALFYLPIALWLFKREDLLLFTVYGTRLEVGLGYVVEKSRYESRRIPIEDRENLRSTPLHRGGVDFLILWYNPLIRDRLSGLVAQLSDTALQGFLHFGYYGQHSYIAVTVSPAHPYVDQTVQEIVGIIEQLNGSAAGKA